jgi:phage terminase small subunit
MTAKKPATKKKPAPKKRVLPLRIDGLLPKQAAFVAEYLLCGNATKAALAAGYSPKTAHVIGTENLKKPAIAAIVGQKTLEIAARQDERLAAMELTVERVRRETARIAFFDPRKMFGADGQPLPITELDDDTAAVINGLEVLEEYEGSGQDRVLVGHVKKYKILDKNNALDRAAKILKMYDDPKDGPKDTLASLLLGIAQGNSSGLSIVAADPERKARQ